MVRKVLVVLSSLTVVALVGVAVSAPAYAGGSKVDARGYSASCSDVTGSVKWSPPLHWSGSAGDFTVKLKLTLSGCTATPTEGGTPVDITKGVHRVGHGVQCRLQRPLWNIGRQHRHRQGEVDDVAEALFR